jgi:hypothetical protein
MAIQIKITELTDIGSNIVANTVLPVVNLAGTAITQKTNVGNIGNVILANAGVTLKPAFLANLAYSVVNAAQPNITSVGTLNVNTLHISGGENGYFLQTDGGGNLTWSAPSSSGNGEVGGASTQIQFNDAGNFGGSPHLTWDASNAQLNTVRVAVSNAVVYGTLDTIDVAATGNITANIIETANLTVTDTFTASGNIEASFFIGNGSALTGITATAAGAGPDTSIQFNDNGVFAGDANLTWDAANATINTGNVVAEAFYGNIVGNTINAEFLIGDGSNITNIINVEHSNTANSATVAGIANSVAVSNVVGIGNIATVSLDGNSSNILYGNGVFDSIPNPFNQNLNTTDNVQFANVTSTEAIKFSNAGDIVGALGYAPTFVSIESYGGNTVQITANDFHTWSFGNTGVLSKSDANGLVLAASYSAQIITDYGDNDRTWLFDGTSGELVLPGGNVLIDPTDDNFEVRGAQSINFEANAVVNIYTDTSNNVYQWQFGDDGTLTSPNSVVQNASGSVTCNAGAPTVIYTGSSTGKTTLKLLIQVEGAEVLGQQWDTQSCEMVVARGLRNNTVVGSVYGLAYTSTNPLATFNAIWNNATSRIEITCTPASLTLGVEARVTVTEMITSA